MGRFRRIFVEPMAREFSDCGASGGDDLNDCRFGVVCPGVHFLNGRVLDVSCGVRSGGTTVGCRRPTWLVDLVSFSRAVLYINIIFLPAPIPAKLSSNVFISFDSFSGVLVAKDLNVWINVSFVSN